MKKAMKRLLAATSAGAVLCGSLALSSLLGSSTTLTASAATDSVADALAEAESKGIRLIDKAPRKGAEGLNIAFLHPKSRDVCPYRRWRCIQVQL